MQGTHVGNVTTLCNYSYRGDRWQMGLRWAGRPDAMYLSLGKRGGWIGIGVVKRLRRGGGEVEDLEVSIWNRITMTGCLLNYDL